MRTLAFHTDYKAHQIQEKLKYPMCDFIRGCLAGDVNDGRAQSSTYEKKE